MGLRNLPSEGSVWPNYMPSGISAYETPMPPELTYSCAPPIPESMELSGWRSYYHTTTKRTVLRVEKHFPNGRYHQIRLDTDGEEGVHIHAKRMLNPDEIPTIRQFGLVIAPQLAKKMNGLVKKTKRKSTSSDNESEGS